MRYATQAGSLAAVDDKVLIWGSLGPLVESYRPDRLLEHDQGVACYQSLVEVLEPYVHAYLGETLSCVEEARQVLEAVGSTAPVGLSFCLSEEGTLRDGEAVDVALLRLLEKHPASLFAILFNCSTPEAITRALKVLRANETLSTKLVQGSILLGAYANRLTPVVAIDEQAAQPLRDDVDAREYYERFVLEWVDEYGVQLVGGCCGIGPEHIAYLHERLQARLV